MITLRPHERGDIPLRVKWLNNKQANLFAVDDPTHVTTIAEQEKWFDEYEEQLKLGQKKFFTILNSETPVGFLGLSHINREKKEGDVFIMIGEDGHRGRGIGREALKLLLDFAFGELKLNRLGLGVHKLNEPALRLYRSAGFKEVGESGQYLQLCYK